jgi:hypothetical protein
MESGPKENHTLGSGGTKERVHSQGTKPHEGRRSSVTDLRVSERTSRPGCRRTLGKQHCKVGNFERARANVWRKPARVQGKREETPEEGKGQERYCLPGSGETEPGIRQASSREQSFRVDPSPRRNIPDSFHRDEGMAPDQISARDGKRSQGVKSEWLGVWKAPIRSGRMP